ncbi:uncharacterized protein C4orf17 homolog isoform X2 [Opisthocomus hoazin]|uniref:uncharacterized protein C4orf17 homolog isoform X2 n=1 Tax=Opisthocomus hoazin TaxID=30419 RepID=UPI003F53D567
MWQNNWYYSESSCSGRKYYFSRNVPHPRMVYHMPGLNNTQVCVVRNRVLHKYPSAGKTAIPKQDADEELAVTRNATGNATASCYSPSLETLEQGEPGTSWPMTGRTDVPEGIQNETTSSEKLRRKQFRDSAQLATGQKIHRASVSQPSTPFINSQRGPGVQEKGKSYLNYLEQDIKVLKKLGKVLQTDSLTKIQQWFASASKKEKDFVISQIYTKVPDEGVLNYKEGTAENMDIQSLLKLQTGPEGDMNRSRLGSRGPAQADKLLPAKNCSRESAMETKTPSCPDTLAELSPATSHLQTIRQLPSREGPHLQSHGSSSQLPSLTKIRDFST